MILVSLKQFKGQYAPHNIFLFYSIISNIYKTYSAITPPEILTAIRWCVQKVTKVQRSTRNMPYFNKKK